MGENDRIKRGESLQKVLAHYLEQESQHLSKVMFQLTNSSMYLHVFSL